MKPSFCVPVTVTRKMTIIFGIIYPIYDICQFNNKQTHHT